MKQQRNHNWNILALTAVGLMLMSGCLGTRIPIPPEKLIECNVDADSVLGRHYEATDFQLWHASPANEWYLDKIKEMNVPDGILKKFSALPGLDVSVADTAVVGREAVRVFKQLSDGTACRYAWAYIEPDTLGDHPVGEYFCLIVLYGNSGDKELRPLLDGTQVEYAKAEWWDNRPYFTFKFNDAAKEQWRHITNESIGQHLPVTLGHRVLAVPVVYSEIDGGVAALTGLDEATACALVKLLSHN